MRATQRRRSPSRTFLTDVDPQILARLAAVVRYVGSVEHKDTPSFAGRPPRPRPDATLCDRALADSQELLTQWLRTAIGKGAIGGPWDGDFLRYAWLKTGDTVYEARVVNRAQGTYKGYSLLPEEWPKNIEAFYD